MEQETNAATVRRLQGTVRRLEIMVGILVAVMGGLLMLEYRRGNPIPRPQPAPPAIAEVIRARKLLIVNEEDKPMVALGMLHGGGVVVAYGPNKGKAALIGRDQGGAVMVYGNDGMELAGMAALKREGDRLG